MHTNDTQDITNMDTNVLTSNWTGKVKMVLFLKRKVEKLENSSNLEGIKGKNMLNVV